MNLANIKGKLRTNESKSDLLRTNKWLYFFLALELVVALVWTSICVIFEDPIGKGIVSWWYFGLVAGLICLVLSIVTYFLESLQRFPLNLLIYILFLLSFAHFAAFLVCLDSTRALYFALWLLSFAIFGLCLHILTQDTFPGAIESFFITFGVGALVLLAFIIFTNGKFYIFFLVYLATSIYAYYLSFNLREILNRDCGNKVDDDAISGAVKIWFEADLVLFKSSELLAYGILGCKRCN